MGHLMAATARHPSELISAFQCGFALWHLIRAFGHYNAKKYFVTRRRSLEETAGGEVGDRYGDGRFADVVTTGADAEYRGSDDGEREYQSKEEGGTDIK